MDFNKIYRHIEETNTELNDQYRPIRQALHSNDSDSKMVDALIFAPTSVFASSDEEVSAHARFLEMLGLDVLLASIGTTEAMKCSIRDCDIGEDDTARILLNMGESVSQFQNTFLNIIRTKYITLRNEIYFGIMYKTADYLKYITDNKVSLIDMNLNNINVFNTADISILFDQIRLYISMETRSDSTHISEGLKNIINGHVAPQMFNDIFFTINNLVLNTVYSNELIKMKFTPSEVDMIYHTVSEQLGQYLHNIWSDTMRELYKIVDYMISYMIRLNNDFDTIRRVENYKGLIDPDYNPYK